MTFKTLEAYLMASTDMVISVLLIMQYVEDGILTEIPNQLFIYKNVFTIYFKHCNSDDSFSSRKMFNSCGCLLFRYLVSIDNSYIIQLDCSVRMPILTAWNSNI